MLSRKYIFVYIWFIVYIGLLGLTLNNTAPYHGDESYYMASAIRMVQTGDYLAPVFFGNLRFQKPILPYWLTAAGYKIFGIHLWSGRLPFLMLACGVLFLTYQMARVASGDHHVGVLAALLLSSSTLFIESTRIAMTDLPLTFFTLGSFYFFYKALREPEHIRLYYLIAFIATGLATASKGFLGLIPLAAMMVTTLAPKLFPLQYRMAESSINACHCEESSTKQSVETNEIASQSRAMTSPLKRHLRYLLHPIYWGICGLLGFGWYLYIYLTHPNELMQQFQVESAANLSFSLLPLLGHLLFYPRVLLTYYLPFTAIALYLAVKTRLPLPAQLRPLIWYLGTAFLTVLIVLKEDRARYLLFLLPVLSVLFAYILEHTQWRARAMKIAIIWGGLQLLVFVVYPMVSGDPLKHLIHYWEQNLHGTLASYELPTRELSWAQALSHGQIQEFNEQSAYILVDESTVRNFARYEVIQQADRLRKIRWRDGKFNTTVRTFLLIKRLP